MLEDALPLNQKNVHEKKKRACKQNIQGKDDLSCSECCSLYIIARGHLRFSDPMVAIYIQRSQLECQRNDHAKGWEDVSTLIYYIGTRT
ncbi:hypothetical protein CDL15_Pgr006253 [Punica granatum]|uniref:Uncharacterized protein n=1 Tax=Punica granatum TaxID=22663 RepID=A0A218X5D8_PUNGR|nr:hypothetical protein CDL15_Pgr006253 [Punica granatum]